MNAITTNLQIAYACRNMHAQNCTIRLEFVILFLFLSNWIAFWVKAITTVEATRVPYQINTATPQISHLLHIFVVVFFLLRKQNMFFIVQHSVFFACNKKATNFWIKNTAMLEAKTICFSQDKFQWPLTRLNVTTYPNNKIKVSCIGK